MERIIVPVDFSPFASWGFYYAYEMARLAKVELIALNLYLPPYMESTDPIELVERIINEKEAEITKHLEQFTQAPVYLAEKDRITVKHIVRSSSEYDITQVAKELNADLIVMGTHGSGRALDNIWGSYTSRVVRDAHCPVLVVPSGTNFKPIQHIAYATDFDKKDEILLAKMALFATAIKAQLHCVHVSTAGEPIQENKSEEFVAFIKQEFGNLSVTYSQWSATSIEEGLEIFCSINQINLLAMLTHNKTLWEQVMGQQSLTKKMTMRTKLPLLAFHA